MTPLDETSRFSHIGHSAPAADPSPESEESEMEERPPTVETEAPEPEPAPEHGEDDQASRPAQDRTAGAAEPVSGQGPRPSVGDYNREFYDPFELDGEDLPERDDPWVDPEKEELAADPVSALEEEGVLTSDEEMSEEEPDREDNQFHIFRSRAIRRMAAKMKGVVESRKVKVGATLVVAALALAGADRMRQAAFDGPATTAAAVTLDDTYSQVRDILSAPTYLGLTARRAEAGNDYIAGIVMAQRVLLNRAYDGLSDPEAKLGVVAAAVEHGLPGQDPAFLAFWMDRLESLEGQEGDYRAEKLKAVAHARMADLVEGDSEQQAELHRRFAQISEAEAEAGAKTVTGDGWSRDIAITIGDVIRGMHDQPTEGLEGYRDGVNAALLQASMVHTNASRIFAEGPLPAAVVRFTGPTRTP